MANPFEETEAEYVALVNEEGQYSLWPTFVKVPDGWSIVLEKNDRATCLEYINEHWTDMRPKSLVDAMR
ncbi:MbtH family NRPS accessory protein [[Kitasatospora] papulosa]|nr:MbtH family NRPS accessory protein [[Kitasatospora] papulosa]